MFEEEEEEMVKRKSEERLFIKGRKYLQVTLSGAE